MAVAAVSAMALFANGNSEQVSSYKLGFIGPLTGDYANYGVLCNNAVQLAAEKFNAAGGINGVPVEIIAEDSEGNNEKALSAIEKLSSSDKILGLLGPVFTGSTFAVGERCQNEQIVLITPSATHADITKIGDYIFRTVVSDGLQGEVAGYYFHDYLGYKKLAVLYAKNDYSQGLYKSMSATFEKLGGEIIAAESCQVGDKDFKTQLTKIKAKNPDAIYIPDYTVEMAQILEQASQLGITAPFLSCDGFSNPEIYNLAGNFTDGVIYVGPAKVEASDAYTKFVEEYNAKYNVKPDSFATNAYDAANIMMEALKDCVADASFAKDSLAKKRIALRDGVAATKDFLGVSGTVNFASNGDLVAYQGIYKVNGTTPEYLGAYSVQDGKLVKVSE